MKNERYGKIKSLVSSKLKKDREASNKLRNKNSRSVATDKEEPKKSLSQDQMNNLRGFSNTPDRTEIESYNDLDEKDETKKVSRQFRYLRNNS